MVLYGHIPLLLLRPTGADSPLRVFCATCTHLNCTVSYREKENDIFCACHIGIYNADGKNISGPPPRPLQQYFSKIRGKDGEMLVIAMKEEDLKKAMEKENLEKAS